MKSSISSKPLLLSMFISHNTASAFVTNNKCNTVTPWARTTNNDLLVLKMGLFDGVKEAFGADGMGELDGDRETPIDRWMGWNAKRDDGTGAGVAVGSKAPQDFIDSMDAKNYITTSLSKPMGIVFEENDSNLGGIFVLEINPDSNAAVDATVRPGDQLVAVGEKKVSGLQFEEALGAIIDSEEEKVRLLFFRGPAKFLYGAAGASQEWLDEFIAGKKEGEKVEVA